MSAVLNSQFDVAALYQLILRHVTRTALSGKQGILARISYNYSIIVGELSIYYSFWYLRIVHSKRNCTSRWLGCKKTIKGQTAVLCI